jgi:tetratricopeptide (TPR) repeat protein
MKKKLFIILNAAFLILHSFCFSQQSKIDSLKNLLKTDKKDTNKVIHLNKLCREYELTGNNDSAKSYGTTALQLAEQIKYKRGIATAYKGIGNIYSKQSDYVKALEYYLKALNLAEEIGDKALQATTLGNISPVYNNQGDYQKALDYGLKALDMAEEIGDKNGIVRHTGNLANVYYNQGYYPKSLEYYLQALKLAEEIGNKREIAKNLSNIGLVYDSQNNYVKALEYYFKALKIKEELGGKNEIAITLENIGNIYHDQLKQDKALDCFFKALKVFEENGNKKGVTSTLGNIGNVYNEQAKANSNSSKKEELFNKALGYYFKALKIAEELNDKKETIIWLQNIGSLYVLSKKYSNAYTYLYRSLALSDSIGALYEAKDEYNYLSDLYEKSTILLPDTVGGKILTIEQMRLRSKYYYMRSIATRDTLFSEESKKQLVRKEMNYEFDKKETLIKIEHEKQIAIAETEKKKQRIVMILVSCGLALVLVFAGFIFRSLRVTKKQKYIIELQKDEVSRQKHIVEKQKHIVEEKQKEMIDSINYAKRIQYGLLASNDLLNKYLPQHFVMFNPKDIVSGDFYWATEYKNNFYLAVCDSTGHGVPGAFMSILNIGFLSEAIKEKGIVKPNEILNYVRSRLIETISREGQKDGMDCILIRLEGKKTYIEYAAANNEPILLRDGKIIELAKDKMPVGKGEKTDEFTLHTIDIQKGDSLILYTDGYADQFGGDKGKKFKYKPLNELLLANQQTPCNEQKEILNSTFTEWKGNLEQVDDVTIIGIKF